ncbi:MAG: type II secretion system protein GspN [Deltaproteobacteria bacterium CG11_big_fil_rev_8_21_14_0_20_47_16]|nr:MAG: type II secretion system protein GspN [Deltaproteobacteria bacterium CG11_big_fil_rev_8_21_14_0_20_47_16]
MKRFAQWAGYIVFGVLAFLFFLYWTFPFDQVKGRLEGGLESALGSDYGVRIDSISSSFITGVALKGVTISTRTKGELIPIMVVNKARLRVGLFSVIFGNPSVSFSLDFKKSSIDGTVVKRDNKLSINASLEPMLLQSVPWFSDVLGLNLDGKITGVISMTMALDGKTPSEGAAKLAFLAGELKAGSKIPLGQFGSMDVATPVKFAQNKDSKLVMDWSKGMVNLKEFIWSEGDLQIDLKGQFFTGANLASTRLNINGTIKLSPEFEKEFPIVAMISKQKQADGSYPIALTGNLTHAGIKIGEFTLPL